MYIKRKTTCSINFTCSEVVLYKYDFEDGATDEVSKLTTYGGAWTISCSGPPSLGSGPSQAANGLCYVYLDSARNPTEKTLFYTQSDSLPSNNLILSFNLHAYGLNCVQFEIQFQDANDVVISASNAFVIKNQTQTSSSAPFISYVLLFNLSSPFKTINFIPTTNGVLANYAIDDIVLKAIPSCLISCNSNAKCSGTKCVCNYGFIGDGVNNCTATCISACHPNATCIGTTCICKKGFTGNGVNNCTATCISTCHPNATCIGTTCICKKGFNGDGVNNCTATCSSACHPNATCVGTACICKNGFIGNGVYNCTATCSSACHLNATCVGTACICKNGFIGDGVNNCTATCSSSCHLNATCVGTTCICKKGFSGDGVNNCTATCSSACHLNATCVGTTCICKNGFIGDGVNNCTANCISACHFNATCIDTTCICKKGFVGDGVINCTATCSSACHLNATCVDTTCICKNGFIGDGVNNCTVTLVSWTQWGNYSCCNISFGNGLMKRSRECISINEEQIFRNVLKVSFMSNISCPGNSSEIVECFVNSTIQVSWTQWSNWTVCDYGKGLTNRTRECVLSKSTECFIGKNLEVCDISSITKQCPGNSAEVVECFENQNGEKWTLWSECSVTCGIGIRSCYNLSVENVTMKVKFCKKTDCPVDGMWGGWNELACSKVCGGMKGFFRSCDYPSSYNGRNCLGISNYTERCDKQICSVNGDWSNWSSWSSCNQPCHNGIQTRFRNCNNPKPRFRGLDCYGNDTETISCSFGKCKKLDFKFGISLVNEEYYSSYNELESSASIALKDKFQKAIENLYKNYNKDVTVQVAFHSIKKINP